MINIFKNQNPFAKNDQKALAKNENFSKFKICNFLGPVALGVEGGEELVHGGLALGARRLPHHRHQRLHFTRLSSFSLVSPLS